MDGAELAKPLESVEAEIESSFDSAVPELRRRWSMVRFAAGVMFAGIAEFALWQSGYPAARLPAIAVVLLCLVTMMPTTGAMTQKAPLEQADRLSLRMLGNGVLLQLLVWLTGGLRSPFLVIIGMSFATLQSAFRWSRTTKALASLHAAGLAAMVFSPAWVLGPLIADRVHAMITCASLLMASLVNFSIVEVLARARKAAEEALRRARELMLDQVYNRTRDLEAVSASLSHELKNPLQAIKILVQLSAREVKEPEAQERLRVAAQEVERMQALIVDYLSFSRPFDKLQAEAVDLGPLVDEVVAVFSDRAAQAGVSLERRGAARVEADARRVREALHNLVSNALEACASGANVVIEISEINAGARIAVRDSGRGMSKDVMEKLGTPFFTTRSEGTGLGVALARAVFAQHGGSLRYESSPGTGTVATAVLPKKPAKGAVDVARADR